MAILIHYHTAIRETIVPVSKRMKTGDAKAGDDVLTPSCRIFKGTERRCARCGRPRAAHFAVRNSGDAKTGDGLNEQINSWRDYYMPKETVEELKRIIANDPGSRKASLAKGELQKRGAKTGDSDEPHPFVGEKADNGDGIGDCEECGKPFNDDAHWRTADVKKSTEAALDLGAPVNREYLRLQKAVPGDKTIRTQLEAKFTPEQVKAWESYF
jgi:hypothetical protein